MYDEQTNSSTNPAADQTSPLLGTDPSTTSTPGGIGTNPTVLPTGPTDTSASTTTSPLITPTTTPSDDLVAIKKKALDELSPLVGKLDQSPEEKYKTLMMMIQASDNQDLVHAAYEAAQKITDEKARAEALLNIVNEINYFTQKSA